MTTLESTMILELVEEKLQAHYKGDTDNNGYICVAYNEDKTFIGYSGSSELMAYRLIEEMCRNEEFAKILCTVTKVYNENVKGNEDNLSHNSDTHRAEG